MIYKCLNNELVFWKRINKLRVKDAYFIENLFFIITNEKI